MKTFTVISIVSIMVFMAIGTVQAAQVTLAWDPNVPTPTGYALFSHDYTGPYDYANAAWPKDGADHAETTATLTVPDDVETAFVARAYVKQTMLDGSIVTAWSGDSNEVRSLPQVQVETPKNLIIQAIQAMADAMKALAQAVKQLN